MVVLSFFITASLYVALTFSTVVFGIHTKFVFTILKSYEVVGLLGDTGSIFCSFPPALAA